MASEHAATSPAGPKVPLFDNKNFLSGLFFLGTGGLGIFMAQDYPMGSALRMGPGYFPIVLSGMLILFGIYCLVQGLLKPEKLPGNWSPRAFLVLPISLIIFGQLMEHAGFIPALIALIFVSAFAGREFKIVEVIVMAIGLVIGCWALFIYGLGLPYPLFVGH
jgi:putative tricarboxylic transport membrane protein